MKTFIFYFIYLFILFHGGVTRPLEIHWLPDDVLKVSAWLVQVGATAFHPNREVFV